MIKVKIDMSGWKMSEHGIPDSRLTVVKQVEDYIQPNGTHVAQWLCECSCVDHNQIVALGYNIRRGDVKSCGCFKREMMSSSERHPVITNKYDLSGNYGIGWTNNTNKEFYFDLEDYDKIKDYCWSETQNESGYSSLISYKRGTRNINVKMHYIIAGKHCDHANRNALDNRKENLRPATYSQNKQNQGIRKDNTSGFIGVKWNKKTQKWNVTVNINKKQKWLGSFCDKEDAIKVRLQAEAKYYGEFAPQRHLFEEYGIIAQN